VNLGAMDLTTVANGTLKKPLVAFSMVMQTRQMVLSPMKPAALARNHKIHAGTLPLKETIGRMLLAILVIGMARNRLSIAKIMVTRTEMMGMLPTRHAAPVRICRLT